MKFIVIKAKYIILAAVIALLIPIIGISITKTVSVFNVNGREIPIYSVERDDNKIALTFDCAWNDDDIDSILNILDEYNCKATFFVTGDWVEKYGESLLKIIRRGHEIGNHSYNHADYTKLSAEKIIADLDKCDENIYYCSGIKPSLARAPSGGYNNTVIKAFEESGRTYIQWSVDGIDYGDADMESIYQRVVPQTQNGDIILLHNGTKCTALILPEILKALTANFELCTVSELIYDEGYTIDHTGRQHKDM